MAAKQLKPKTTCCLSRSRCRRCPIRMLKAGTLPDGYTVKQRKLVKTGGGETTIDKKRDAKKKSGKKAKKSARKERKRLAAVA